MSQQLKASVRDINGQMNPELIKLKIFHSVYMVHDNSLLFILVRLKVPAAVCEIVGGSSGCCGQLVLGQA